MLWANFLDLVCSYIGLIEKMIHMDFYILLLRTSINMKGTKTALNQPCNAMVWDVYAFLQIKMGSTAWFIAEISLSIETFAFPVPYN